MTLLSIPTMLPWSNESIDRNGFHVPFIIITFISRIIFYKRTSLIELRPFIGNWTFVYDFLNKG